MTRLLLIRHGESTWNAERRWQGWADAPLSELGVRQAEQAARHLAGFGLSVAASSDLSRARRTAAIIASHLRIELVATEAGLRERNFGEWSGCTAEEIEARWPGALTAHRAGRLPRPPGGEDVATLVARGVSAMVDLGRRLEGQKVLVVSHGGLIRSLERHLGVETPVSTPNLGGRWFDLRDGALVPGDSVAFVDADLATAPPSR